MNKEQSFELRAAKLLIARDDKHQYDIELTGPILANVNMLVTTMRECVDIKFLMLWAVSESLKLDGNIALSALINAESDKYADAVEKRILDELK